MFAAPRWLLSFALAVALLCHGFGALAKAQPHGSEPLHLASATTALATGDAPTTPPSSASERPHPGELAPDLSEICGLPCVAPGHFAPTGTKPANSERMLTSRVLQVPRRPPRHAAPAA